MGRRVVHVVDPMNAGWAAGDGLLGHGSAADIALLASAEAIRVRPDDVHIVLALGTHAAAQHAQRLGLRVHATIPAVLGHAGLSCRELRRTVIELGGTDVLQPWSERARTACRLAAAGNGPVATLPSQTWPCLDQPIGDKRNAVRASLGVLPDTPLVALLADPVRHAEARRFVYMVGLLDVAGLTVAGLVDRRSAHVPRARRFHAEACVQWRMLLPEEPTARLLHACDIGVVVPPSIHGRLRSDERSWVRWSILRAHMLGVPVIGAQSWLPREAIPSQYEKVLRARSASVTDIARQLTKLTEDREHFAELSAAVREAALRVSTPERYADALDSLWNAVSRLREHSRMDVALG